MEDTPGGVAGLDHSLAGNATHAEGSQIEVKPKEIIIILFMILLWLFSIHR